MRVLIFTFFMLLGSIPIFSQYFLELRTEFDDSFREWEILLEKDSTEIFGELELTWSIGNDFTQWRYRVDDLDGDIVQKFNNNPGFWELRSVDKLVSIRQVWPGDPNQWKISCDERSFVFRTLYNNQLDEWTLSTDRLGELIVFTNVMGDPRDWIISDFMSDDVSFEERMAAIFIAIYTSTPKY